MAKNSLRKKPVLRSNLSISIDKFFFQNSIWSLSYGNLLEQDYEEVSLLLNYGGDIWASKNEFRSAEKIGNWKVDNESLFIEIEQTIEELIKELDLGFFEASLIILGTEIEKKIKKNIKQLIDILEDSHYWLPIDITLSYTGISKNEHNYYKFALEALQRKSIYYSQWPENIHLNNFLSQYNRIEHFPHCTDLIFREPFYLFIDVETNGLPSSQRDPKIYPKDYPEVIQIGTLICDSLGKRIGGATKYIMPKGWRINEDVRSLLNIDENKMKETGFYLNHWSSLTQDEYYDQIYAGGERVSDHLKQLFGLLSNINITYIVGHNIDYDINCLEALYYRNLDKWEFKDFTSAFKKEFLNYLDGFKKICTMKSTIEYCKIRTNKGYKYPKLEELYRTLFESDLPNAHNAGNDTFNTAKCYWKLVDLSFPFDSYETADKMEDSKIEKIKILSLDLTDENEGYVRYRRYFGNTMISNGIAFCKDVNAVELDEDDYLTGNSRLSQDGEKIIQIL